jgi:hypothetical protein
MPASNLPISDELVTRPTTAPQEGGSGPRSSRRQAVLLVLLLITSALSYTWIRTRDLDRVVTVDEPVFLAISANFANAIAHRDFRETSQFLYPAVPIMWAGTIGIRVVAPNYTKDSPDQIDKLYFAHEPLRAVGYGPLNVLNAARGAKVTLQACVLVVALWLIARLFGLAITALTAAFIVFDPFLVGHDQLLHVDGMTGITAFASMLAVANADQARERNRFWALAAVLAALCWLTRLTGLVLLPIFLIVIADHAIVDYREHGQTGKEAISAAARTAGLVIGTSVLTTFVLWPALWVDPVGAIQETTEVWRDWAGTPHPWGLFFQGRTIEGDPGVLFYIYVFLYKITPFTLVGLGLIATALLFRIKPLMPRGSWRPIVILGFFAVVYTAGLVIGQRKFDRYILPDFLFFDLFAAIGIVGLASHFWSKPALVWRAVTVGVIIGLVVGQAVLAASQFPYPLDYFNPMLGGAKTAEDQIMVGWGEGQDQAANYILSQPGGDVARVSTTSPPSSMLYFLPDTATVQGIGVLGANQESILMWANTDYLVTHILQWQRDMTGVIDQFVGDLAPVQTVKIDGIPFVKVYDLRSVPPPTWMIELSTCSWRFDDKFTLAAYGPYPPVAAATTSSDTQMIEIILQTNTTEGLAPNYELDGILTPKDGGDPPIAFSTTFAPYPQPGMLAKAVWPIQLPEGKELTDYWLQVSVPDPETGEPLPTLKLTNRSKGDRSGQPGC